MITIENLKNIVADQKNSQTTAKIVKREKNLNKTKRIVIVTGVRRCGKSTFLRQLFNPQETLALNFEDPRLEGFDLNDFTRLEQFAREEKKTILLFDEIQNVPEWEKYARSANDRNISLFITGSNASMLSKELGTRLTGRYMQTELFPFNYHEYLTYTEQVPDISSFKNYLEQGGFPEYLQENNPEYLRTLLSDIIMRDIAVRRDIRNERLLIRLAVHMVSNIAKEFSYNNTSKILEIKSVRTTIDYCDFLQESYLLELIPRFSFSIRQQLANPKKAYCIDTAMARANSLSFSSDYGRIFENAVFLQLRRNFNDISYYKNSVAECDFLIKESNQVSKAFQVCSKVDETNIKREISGLESAMKETGCKQGAIITLDQEDTISGIRLIPAWKWMSEGDNNSL